MFEWNGVTNLLDTYGPELLLIQVGFLIILATMFLWLWFHNRKKYHNLKHAIPADIVKSYLDSIIMNSTSLKSQLFRGGGLDVGSVPSVMPLHNLVGGESLAVSGAPSTALLEELNQKKAQIAALEAQVSNSQGVKTELENKLGSTQSGLSSAESKIKELESLLAKARAGGSNSGGGGDETLKAELNMVTKERDDLRDRLKEFEIIADDLANLKRLQQENEQLKKSLAAQGAGGGPVEIAEKEVPKNIISQAEVSDLFEDLGQSNESQSTDNAALEEFLSSPTDSDVGLEEPAPMEEAPVAEAPTMEAAPDENKPKLDKTPEDLLSEFEKMLG